MDMRRRPLICRLMAWDADRLNALDDLHTMRDEATQLLGSTAVMRAECAALIEALTGESDEDK